MTRSSLATALLPAIQTILGISQPTCLLHKACRWHTRITTIRHRWTKPSFAVSQAGTCGSCHDAPPQSAINCCMMTGIDSFREWLHRPALPAAKYEPLLKNSHDSTFPGKAEHGSQPKTATLTDATATRRVRHPKTATQTGYPANPSTHRIRIRLRCRPLSEAKYGSRSERAVAAGTDRHAGTQHHAMRYDSAYDTKAPRP